MCHTGDNVAPKFAAMDVSSAVRTCWSVLPPSARGPPLTLPQFECSTVQTVHNRWKGLMTTDSFDVKRGALGG